MCRVCCLLLAPPACPSSRYAVYNLIPYMRDCGVDVEVLPFYCPWAYGRISRRQKSLEKAALIGWGYFKRIVHWVKASRSDVVWIHRFAAPIGTGLLGSALKALGKPLVFGYDDAVYLARGKANQIRSWFGSWRDIDDLVAKSDYVLARNQSLGDHARMYNPNVLVLPSAIDVTLYNRVLNTASQAIKDHSAFVIGWIGTPSSAPYLELVHPVLEKLGQEGPVELRLIGGDMPDVAGVTVNRIRWQQATEIEELCQADVGIAPLPDGEWARGKSGLKVVQYMGCGLPVVASAVGSHLGLLESGKHGFLAHTDEEWLQALRVLRDSKSLRVKMGAAGRQKVRLQHDFSVIAKATADVFIEICGNKQKTIYGK